MVSTKTLSRSRKVLIAKAFLLFAIATPAQLLTKNSSAAIILLPAVGGIIHFVVNQSDERHARVRFALMWVVLALLLIAPVAISFTRPHPYETLGHVLDFIALGITALCAQSALQIRREEREVD